MEIFLTTLFISQILATPSIFETRIINGENAQEGQVPYIVSYQAILPRNRFVHLCGGSIITKMWVITAGHCITGAPPEYHTFQIVAGSSNLIASTSNRQEISVVQRIVHPRYLGDANPYDLALLRLETSLVFGSLVQPIRLPPAGSSNEGIARISGWGYISTFPRIRAPTKLQTAEVELMSFDECRQAMRALSMQDVVFEDVQVCTRPSKQAVCNGDSGGPLVQDGFLIGILSWGPAACWSRKIPDVYTKISGFIKFIEKHVNIQNSDETGVEDKKTFPLTLIIFVQK